MKLVPHAKAHSKNHLFIVIGTAMAIGLAYLWIGPKLVKTASIPASHTTQITAPA
jgi:hypothetical protein